MDGLIIVPLPFEVAKERKILWYFTGLPCKHGHICQRQTSNRSCRQCVLGRLPARNKLYYQKNKEKVKAQTSEYQRKNKEARNAYKSKWNKRKSLIDSDFAALLAMRKMVSRVFDRLNQKRRETVRTVEFLGFTTDEFKAHIERQFQPGMTWENRKEWHVDHIVPLSSFDLNCETERKRANALTNLRPIWKRENLLKSDARVFLI